MAIFIRVLFDGGLFEAIEAKMPSVLDFRLEFVNLLNTDVFGFFDDAIADFWLFVLAGPNDLAADFSLTVRGPNDLTDAALDLYET
uniref:Uncharacterized protein n=1 Tax=Romanomermis culicivorax TaxID=13658 RepID=A0A915JG78_ROMCU